MVSFIINHLIYFNFFIYLFELLFLFFNFFVDVWKRTQDLIEECDLTRTDIYSLDLCCGEGATCVYIADRYGGKVNSFLFPFFSFFLAC